MICEILPAPKNGGTFSRLMHYIAGGNNDEKTLFTGSVNMVSESATLAEQIREMEIIASNNIRCKKQIFHAILSWRENENPTEEQCREAIELFLEEEGMSQCLAFYGLHVNTKNRHLDICVNKIDPETFKAVDPGGGYSKYAGERAVRKIEMKQGWQPSAEKGNYRVKDDGTLELKTFKERREERGQPATEKGISQQARNYETRVGEKSAERIAKEMAAPILFIATSWQEVHEKLAAVGITIQPRKGGGVLVVDGTPVKLSTASQKLSFKKLESRLGKFVPSSEFTQKTAKQSVEYASQQELDSASSSLPKRQGEQAEDAVHQPLSDDPSLKQYLEERRNCYIMKPRIRKEIERLEEERKKLKEQQKKEREALYKSRESWKGHGDELNAQRSILAAKHIRDREKLYAQIKELRKQLRGRGFPSYVEWLKRVRKNELASDLWRYRRSQPGFIFGESYSLTVTTLELFTPQLSSSGGRQCVDYMKNNGKVVFRDSGKLITVFTGAKDREAVLAAMKLAAQKWGSLMINGSDEFKSLCVELAVEHGISIRNPSLQGQIEAMKKCKIEGKEKEKEKEKEESWRYGW